MNKIIIYTCLILINKGNQTQEFIFMLLIIQPL